MKNNLRCYNIAVIRNGESVIPFNNLDNIFLNPQIIPTIQGLSNPALPKNNVDQEGYLH
jgi:hypothetical protein